MVVDDAGPLIDRLRRQLADARRMDVLSESFSIFVFEALRKELAGVPVRLLLRDGSIDELPLNGLGEEHVLRAHLDQHRIAREFLAWAEQHLETRSLSRRSRDTWTVIEAAKPYAVLGAGFEAESLGLVASSSLLFPREISDEGQVEELAINFDRIWHEPTSSRSSQGALLDAAQTLARDNAPESAYLRILTSLFRDFVDEAGKETADRGRTGFFNTTVWSKLYKFQRDGVLGAIEKLDRHNGCILADSVGLGKTFEALAVIKYYELRNDRVLVLAPKRLRENWTLYRANDARNPLVADRFNYDVLNHTDLSRENGMSGDIDLAHVNWGNYDLVVIDESHNFRNNPQVEERTTRYERLMNQVFKAGVKTKVLMLSATPVNTRLADLKNQVLFATEGDDTALTDSGIKSIEGTLRKAQARFTIWQNSADEQRTTDALLGALGMDYIRLLDLITIARSRKHIEKYYGTADVGRFPERVAPVNLAPPIDAADKLMPLADLNSAILMLNLAAYKPTSYVLEKAKKKYADLYDHHLRTGGSRVWRQTDRENNIVHLMRMGLLKRLESSVHSLTLTVDKILHKVDAAIARIDDFEARDAVGLSINSFSDLSDIDMDDQELEDVVGGKVRVFLADVDRVRWRQDLVEDRDTLREILAEVSAVDVLRDAKLADLKGLLVEKAKNPSNGDNRKALIFTAYSDTAEYLYANVAEWAVADLGLHVALITGDTTKTTAALARSGMHEVLAAFSPRSKGGDLDGPQIDVVIATDTISEGQNLQDCDTVVNYDIHWNPVRIVQRFGRVDRLGSTNATVHLVNFWPNIDLESYINLEKRVSSRMTLLDVSATGEENVLDSSDAAAMNDLEYRRRQLEQMRVAAPTMEDLAGGLSITDLTLSDFRMDAAARPACELEEIDRWPLALFAVSRFDGTLSEEGLSAGAIYLFKARDGVGAVPADYPLAPYLLVYVTDNGEIAHPIEQPKLALDVLRHHALGQTEPDTDALAAFNAATRKGRDMGHYRDLLDTAVRAASGKAKESAVASLFSAGASTYGVEAQSGGLTTVDLVAWVALVP
ncbi:helicase-related protein [Oryzihumus leptocrescens]|uniref:Type III restriction/modification enzyme restriction subunit n=1 Tax=Oryzihumus leptocrescens TaxID=297536 RepID=A0A542ZKX2_9MICO|nr:helicase-related protein [Oryzihumus leptocrescens]TQL60986.1 type III restriction/modification enzyme restriction subunit [Oryzihumus leptocrescens]